MKRLMLLLGIFFLSSYSPDECDVKELNYLMDKIEYKAKVGDVNKELIREWLCKNENINFI